MSWRVLASLSSIERGLVVVTVKTLRTIAEGLGVHPADILASLEDGPSEAVLEASRHLAPETLVRWVSAPGAFTDARATHLRGISAEGVRVLP